MFSNYNLFLEIRFEIENDNIVLRLIKHRFLSKKLEKKFEGTTLKLLWIKTR